MALVETHDWLTSKVSYWSSAWIWRNVHVNDYDHMPFSKTPLKFLFHRSVGAAGNDNTPNVSKISPRKNADNSVISSTASANFKMLISLAKKEEDDVSLFSIDTGMNGNLFSGHYFDMNKDHLEGRLKTMHWRPNSLNGVPTTTLTITPSSGKNQEKSSNDEL